MAYQHLCLVFSLHPLTQSDQNHKNQASSSVERPWHPSPPPPGARTFPGQSGSRHITLPGTPVAEALHSFSVHFLSRRLNTGVDNTRLRRIDAHDEVYAGQICIERAFMEKTLSHTCTPHQEGLECHFKIYTTHKRFVWCVVKNSEPVSSPVSLLLYQNPLRVAVHNTKHDTSRCHKVAFVTKYAAESEMFSLLKRTWSFDLLLKLLNKLMIFL